MSTVLLVSTSYNDHAKRIEQMLSVQDRLHVLRYNADTKSSFLEMKGLSSEGVLEDGSLKTVSSVFVHHPIVETRGHTPTNEIDNRLHHASWNEVLRWLEECLSDRLWVNRPSVIELTASIPHQLRVANSAGLRVPHTIFTNRKNAVETFAQHIGCRVLLKPGNLRGVSMHGKRILARLINPSDIDGTVLCRSPCLFQEYVEKAYELRVHVVRDVVLACRIDSQQSKKASVDWRNYDLRNTPHHLVELETSLANACRTIVRNLRLEFGILDIIITPQGDAVFLECNAQGHWIWIEELTGLPITACVCDLLASRT